MGEKVSVTVPLTAGQKARIKRAMGKTISAVKVESAGSATPKAKVNLAARYLTRQITAKVLTKRMAPRALTRKLTTRQLTRRMTTKALV